MPAVHILASISRVNRLRLTQFQHHVDELTLLLMQQLALQYSNPIQKASVMNEGGVGDCRSLLPIWPQNCLPRECLSHNRKANVRLVISSYTSTNSENLVRIGSVYSQITCLKVETIKE